MSNKPFDLEKALAGEPVVLRNGCKGFIKFRKPSYCDFSPSSELGGYWINNKNIAITENWRIDGAHYDDSNIYIVGMWQESRPRVTLDLPCSLKEPQEGMWYFINSEVYKSSYIEGGEQFDIARLKSGGYFVTKEDAQEWVDAMRNARR